MSNLFGYLKTIGTALGPASMDFSGIFAVQKNILLNFGPVLPNRFR